MSATTLWPSPLISVALNVPRLNTCRHRLVLPTRRQLPSRLVLPAMAVGFLPMSFPRCLRKLGGQARATQLRASPSAGALAATMVVVTRVWST